MKSTLRGVLVPCSNHARRVGLCRWLPNLSVLKLPHVVLLVVFYTAGLSLFQGAGKRRWSIEDTLTTGEEEDGRLVQDIDLRVLADFKEAQVRRFIVSTAVEDTSGVYSCLIFVLFCVGS